MAPPGNRQAIPKIASGSAKIASGSAKIASGSAKIASGSPTAASGDTSAVGVVARVSVPRYRASASMVGCSHVNVLDKGRSSHLARRATSAVARAESTPRSRSRRRGSIRASVVPRLWAISDCSHARIRLSVAERASFGARSLMRFGVP